MSLKEKKYDLIPIYDQQLAEAGVEIQRKRKAALYRFNLIFTDLYKEVSGIENVHISYRPSWKEEVEDGRENSNEITVEKALYFIEQKKEMDKAMGTTLSGPHRDNIRFIKDKKPFIPIASTGQRRLIAILLY